VLIAVFVYVCGLLSLTHGPRPPSRSTTASEVNHLTAELGVYPCFEGGPTPDFLDIQSLTMMMQHIRIHSNGPVTLRESAFLCHATPNNFT
jgi:hypothetical protein